MSLLGCSASVSADLDDSQLNYQMVMAVKQVAEELFGKAIYMGSKPKYNTFHMDIRIDPMHFAYFIRATMENELTGYTKEELEKTKAEIERLLSEAYKAEQDGEGNG